MQRPTECDRGHWTVSHTELRRRLNIFVLRFLAVLIVLEMKVRDCSRVAQTHRTRVEIATEFTEYTKTVRHRIGS
jgi:hypothetical protein